MNSNQTRPKLSAHGEQRRSAILRSMQRELAHRVHRRKQKGIAACIVTTAILAGSVWWISAVDWESKPIVNIVTNSELTKSSDPFAIENVVVGNRPGVISKYVVTNVDPAIASLITDSQLKELLSEVGLPVVIGKVSGKTVAIPTHTNTSESPLN